MLWLCPADILIASQTFILIMLNNKTSTASIDASKYFFVIDITGVLHLCPCTLQICINVRQVLLVRCDLFPTLFALLAAAGKEHGLEIRIALL